MGTLQLINVRLSWYWRHYGTLLGAYAGEHWVCKIIATKST
jgi:hypothetical protein